MSGRRTGAGKSYWGDLRLIRESRKITLDEVYLETKVPILVLRDFELDGLNFHEHFNDVYRLSLVAAFARAIGVDPVLARESCSATERGLYDGRLAIRYLSWSQPDPDDRGENALTRRRTSVTETRKGRRHARLVYPDNSVRTRWETDWKIVGVLLLLAVVVTALAWVVGIE